MSDSTREMSPAALLARLDSILELRAGPRIDPLVEFGRALSERGPAGGITRDRTVQALLALLEAFAGNGRQRMEMGEVLGRLGDPRLRAPAETEYWQAITMPDGGVVEIGRFPVTTQEFRAWAEGDAFHNDAHWSEDGAGWKNDGNAPWTDLAASPVSAELVVPNQPVAGITWWEAEAYAKANGARLLTAAEHRSACRGSEKRPYPWGAPFGDGNANTKEEALGRPCAVGVYGADRTPDGVCDLAGNIGCWLVDGTDDGRRMLHPGSWARPSMAAWAKALEMAEPGARSADLGFRLARDIS
jgi:formylglycine-generating enzyme required for sulfatase activity